MANTETLVGTIIDGMLDKKAEQITSLNFTKTPNGFCDYFIICNGRSDRQVLAISDSVEEKAFIELKEKVFHKEGKENAQWIILDFSSVVVHIFQEEYRNKYNLEEFWIDAVRKDYEF